MPGLIDHRHLNTQTFGDADLARELLQLFEAQCRRLLPGIADAGLPAPDRADLAHTLKGSALGVGAERIASLSAGIEDSLRRGQPADALHLRNLETAVAATLSEIAALP